MPTVAEALALSLPAKWQFGLKKFGSAVRALETWFEGHGETVMAVLANATVPLEELRTHQLASFVQLDHRLVQVLVERGWYPDPRMAPIQLALLFSYSASEPDAVEEIMKNVFRERLDEIEAELVAAHPTRTAIIQDAFYAHRESRYNLSIPVLLAQADGIWLERVKRNLFSGGAGRAIQELADQIEDANSRELVFALSSPDWPLAASEGERPESFSGLNRHQVLHGEVTNYGIEENSLRAVSFLNYCAFILPAQEEEVTAS